MVGARNRNNPAGAPLPLIPVDRQLAANRLDVRQLIATANELLALAADLEGIVSREPDGPIPMAPATVFAMARAEYRRRRLRGTVFDSDDLFGEPAWDMLLDLFIAGLEGKRVPVTSACIGACVPTTTALRWLSLIEERGLVIREPDPSDARRAHVRLSPEAMRRMEQYFQRDRRPHEG